MAYREPNESELPYTRDYNGSIRNSGRNVFGNSEMKRSLNLTLPGLIRRQLRFATAVWT